MSELTDFYIRNQRFSSPNMDLSHRCILRCPQCLRQKVEGLPRIKRSFDIAFKLIKSKYSNKFINGPINKNDFLKKKFPGITEYISNYKNLIKNEGYFKNPKTIKFKKKKVYYFKLLYYPYY